MTQTGGAAGRGLRGADQRGPPDPAPAAREGPRGARLAGRDHPERDRGHRQELQAERGPRRDRDRPRRAQARPPRPAWSRATSSLEADGRGIEDNSDLSSYISSLAPGTSVRLRVLRDGAEKQLSSGRSGTFPDDDAERAPARERRGSALGMSLRDLTPQLAERLELPSDTRGVVVMDVEAGEPAERAGLQHGDVIVSVNGNAVQSVDGSRPRSRAPGPTAWRGCGCGGARPHVPDHPAQVRRAPREGGRS